MAQLPAVLLFSRIAQGQPEADQQGGADQLPAQSPDAVRQRAELEKPDWVLSDGCHAGRPLSGVQS